MYSFLQSTPQYSLCLMRVLISPYLACTDLCEYNQSCKNIWSKYKPVAYLITHNHTHLFYPLTTAKAAGILTTTITHQPPSNVTLTTSTTNNESLNYTMVMMIMMMMMMMMMIIRAKLTTGLSYLNMNTKLNYKIMIIIKRH